jgi:hypothetical protein
MEGGSSASLVLMYQTTQRHIAKDCIFTWVFKLLSTKDAIQVLAIQVWPLYSKCNSIKPKETEVAAPPAVLLYAVYQY